MGITLRNGVDERGIKTVDEKGIDEMGSYHIQENANSNNDIESS